MFVELDPECNTLPVSKIISILEAFGGKTVMVESPMFFQSVQPILTSLRNFDFESFPLYKQILLADAQDNEGFDYLPVKSMPKPKETLKLRSRSRPHDVSVDGKDAVQNKIEIICEGLDVAQKEAFLYAMNNRLSIIQGPPGCGKTFLGVKIVEALLEWNLQGPIFVSFFVQELIK